TYGKGSVQNVIDLNNGGALKLTIAHYYVQPDTVKNRKTIHKHGIVPDNVIKLTPKEAEALKKFDDEWLAAREKENRWFLGWFTPLRTKIKNAKVRFKNRHVYLYYRCPKCRAWLKLPRHIGEKTVTCSACGATFKKKA
ncbi:MAG: hypothetical protein IKI24_04350, partial [Clostridia bacterium]|nr:hypothetical protein [Clostridia bacterium]